MATHIRAADPLARVIRQVAADPAVIASLGGDSAGRVGSVNRPPYPRIEIQRAPGGSRSSSGRIVTSTVTVGVIGDPDGRHGSALLTEIAWDVVHCLDGLTATVGLADEPVVTQVSTGVPGSAPLSTGQRRVQVSVTLVTHPPRAPRPLVV